MRVFLDRAVRPPVAVHAPVQVHEGGVPVGEGVVPDGVQAAAFGDGGGDDVCWLLLLLLLVVVVILGAARRVGGSFFLFFVDVGDEARW